MVIDFVLNWANKMHHIFLQLLFSQTFFSFLTIISFIANDSFEITQQPIRLDRLGMVSVLLVLDDCYYGSVKELPRVNCSAFYLPTPSKYHDEPACCLWMPATSFSTPCWEIKI